MELLSPAGGPDSLRAAVLHGADAVYLGFGQFNARRNAKNFSEEELQNAIAFCHLYGVKVYLTLNTLLSDREFQSAAASVETASRLGADAVLIQDLGVLRLLRQVAPALPVHASTQMSLHNVDGVLKAADLGITRVVLARELPKSEIAYICAHSPVEIEVFVHGALCMCYSGQCYLSSMIGGRSGNRGLCAQPCRLAYGWSGKADAHPLSLKDMSLVQHLKELESMGVACAKIEGRMKSPDYVSVVTSIYAKAIREKTEPTKGELTQLRAAFSRQGFTDGYFTDKTGPHMFGIRDDASKSARPAALDTLWKRPPIALSANAVLAKGQPAKLVLADCDGHTAAVSGAPVEPAQKKALSKEQVEKNLRKTGGTPYEIQALSLTLGDDLFLPVSEINRLRRDALDAITAARCALPPPLAGALTMPPNTVNQNKEPGFTVSLSRFDQLTKALIALHPLQIYLPLEEAAAHLSELRPLCETGAPLAVSLPRILWDREWKTVEQQLNAVRKIGITTALTGNLGMLDRLIALGFTLRGDFGLNVYNSHAMETLQRLPLQSVTVSFELRLSQVRDLAKYRDTELLVYGRLPLMVMENCIIQTQAGQCACKTQPRLTDRTGAAFPILHEAGCRNLLVNSKTLFLADKKADFQRLGLWAGRLFFTTETGEECADMLHTYQVGADAPMGEFTRGLYYREVE